MSTTLSLKLQDDSQTLTGSKTIRAVCPHDCPDTCSMVITVKDGVAVDLRGDKDHPFTKGFLCQKVNRYLDRTYHKDRVLYPMRRVGPKGAGQFERISWEAALEEIVSRLKGIANSPEGPQSILPFSYAGTMGKLQEASIDRRFFHAIGASLLDRTICATAGTVGCDMTLGGRAVADPFLTEECRHIINWGSNTAVTNSHMWVRMVKAQKQGAKIVTIDPYKTPTASRSDEWIPIRPGTDAALALAMMHVAFSEQLEDLEYLRQYTLGEDQLRQRVAEWTPERAQSITGIPAETIRRLTRDHARARPALIRLNYGLQRHGGGGMAVRTITCIPAVLGTWKDPGGGAMLSTSKVYSFKNSESFCRHDLIPAGTRTINMSRLAEALAGEGENGQPLAPPVKALVVYNSNPAAICPNQGKVIKGLKREDLFTVVLEHFQTDTADYADILLPATTQLEHWDIHSSYGHLMVQLNEPAIAPLGESRPNTEIFREFSRRFDLAREIWDNTDKDLIKEALSPMPHITMERLLADGPMSLDLPKPFAPFAQGHFETPSGKCEFYSQRMADLGLDPLPGYTPPHEDPHSGNSPYPLQMISPPEPAFLNSSFANLAPNQRDSGQPKLRIHPLDAKLREIVSHSKVRVFNDRGSFKALALVEETVSPGVVVSHGIWWNKHTTDGVNVNCTTSTRLTDLGAGATFFDNLVQVETIPS